MYAIAIPAGRLTIRAAIDDAMSCELWLNDCFVGHYPSAASAAHSVSSHRSGCDLIDAGQVQLPDDIDSWQWVSVRSKAAADQPMFLMGSAAGTL
jgi:hypothetical protein